MAAATIRRGRGAQFVGVYIEGLSTFREAMKYAPDTIRRAVKQVDKRWSVRVAGLVRQAAEALGGVAARQSSSIRGSALATGIQLRAGGPGYPEFFGAEFGGGRFRPPQAKSNRRGRPGYTNQFRNFRPKPEVGYFVFPTLRTHVLPSIAEEYLSDMAAALAAAEASRGE